LPSRVNLPTRTPPIIELIAVPIDWMLTPRAAAFTRSGITRTSGMPSW
jgi:hypothetical protein